MIKVYRSKNGLTSVASGRATVLSDLGIDDLFVSDNAEAVLRARSNGTPEGGDSSHRESLENLPPIERQEVWAAGVTYKRSREARMEESEDSGGSTFYDMVYDADRPEIFFKATASRTVGSGSKVSVRGDSSWNVPEPELTLAINARGRIFGYTIGNDMSSRDIEGANPLYLPQAKRVGTGVVRLQRDPTGYRSDLADRAGRGHCVFG
jgi:2-dehydro-3-deoxy-D-arabinonate dehydratase